MTNQRKSDRVPFTVYAELFLPQATVPALIINLSAGGALLSSAAPLERGQRVGMGLRLLDSLKNEAGVDYLHFDLEILQATTQENGTMLYRCKSTARSNSPQYERASKLVIAAQKQHANKSGKKRRFGRRAA